MNKNYFYSKIKIELNNEQLQLVKTALDFYCSVGSLQFDEIMRHPTIHKCILAQFRPDKKLEVGDNTNRGIVVDIGEKYVKTKGNWSDGEEIKTWTDIENIKLSVDYSKFHYMNDKIYQMFNDTKSYISNGLICGRGNLGIYNYSVDESCRVAFDIMQYIRHEFWKADPNRSNINVSSNINLSSNS